MLKNILINDLENIYSTIKESDVSSSDSINNFMILLCKILNKNESDFNSLFCKSNRAFEKSFVSACFLRLMNSNDEAIWNCVEYRVKLFQLFDDEFKEIYSLCGISTKMQNHEKVPILKDLENSFLNSFKKINKSITSLNASINVRNSFMKAIHNKINKIFIDNFIDPVYFSDERIGEVFDALSLYINSTIDNKFDSYKKANSVLVTFIEDTKNCSASSLVEPVIIQPLSKICFYIDEDFKKNDFLKTTKLTVNPIDKKYPFHLPNQNFEFKILINNPGPGYALDVGIEVVAIDNCITIPSPMISIGVLKPGPFEIVFNAKNVRPINDYVTMLGNIVWYNYENKQYLKEFEIIFEPQKSNINWNELSFTQPYSLEAVDTEDELIGRKEVLKTLYSKLNTKKIESVIIFGQKRVGKTSIAKTLKTLFNKNSKSINIFFNAGDLDKSSIENFISMLGETIVDQISSIPLFSSLEKPSFKSSIAPLLKYLRSIHNLDNEIRFVIIIDEFDDIPLSLYPHTISGDAFFHNIRSISSEGYVGFVLVGSENMQIIKQDTDKLNKFDSFRVDYFEKKYWNDFKELICRPTKEYIEFSDDAIKEIYDMTEGNPFYTKYICKRLFSNLCSSQNSFVTGNDAKKAILESLESLETNQLSHFWKDCIFIDDITQRDKIETSRRKYLILFSQKLVSTSDNSNDINNYSLNESMEFANIIESYINRNIIIYENNKYRLKPMLFQQWLIGFGKNALSSGLSDENAIIVQENIETNAFVTDSEIFNLCETWGLYQGHKIEIVYIRQWLDQFSTNIEKRLMFKLLLKIKLYDENNIREKLSVIHNSIHREIVYNIEKGEKVRRDIIISNFGKPSKSGASLTRIYASENNISATNIFQSSDLKKALNDNRRVKAIVFIDDIIGSGDTILKNIVNINNEIGEILEQRKILILIATICGLNCNIDSIKKKTKKYKFKTNIIICDILTEYDQCFNENAEIFKNEEERLKAKEIAYRYGKKLFKYPLGYKEGQLLVVFKDNCPNNTIPIIWATSIMPSWKPLFKRNE